MNAFREIDLASWPRKSLFDFYRTFDCSVYCVTVQVPGGRLYRFAKEHGESFFLMALYAILRAANQVPQMRQRVLGDGRLVEFERIAVMTPIMTEQELFCQIWCEYEETFALFRDRTAPLVEAARQGNPGPMTERGEDFLCASCIPFLHFSSLTQAHYSFHQTTPILGWGKMNDAGEIPVACQFNHCLLDGLHAGRFFDAVTDLFEHPEKLFNPVANP